MHEPCIAEAVLEMARRNVPPGATLRSVRMAAGPMRGIDPRCMQQAWRELVHGEVALNMKVLPWQMECADCGRHWEQPELPGRCACGSRRVAPAGGDDLQMLSIEVDDAPPEENPPGEIVPAPGKSEAERKGACSSMWSKTS
jgi:hydrogenase nickel incorporation protein HypA/HybF